jgi:hypothetical protein
MSVKEELLVHASSLVIRDVTFRADTLELIRVGAAHSVANVGDFLS